MKKMLIFIASSFFLLLAGCSVQNEEVSSNVTEILQDNSAVSIVHMETAQQEDKPGSGKEKKQEQSESDLNQEEELICETDPATGKPACPLPPKAGAIEDIASYQRTEAQLKRMQEFEAMSMEEKQAALASGKIACILFLHDNTWEHEIPDALIEAVGEDAFSNWAASDEAGCGSIYDFAKKFQIKYSTIEACIVENNLQETYDLAVLKKNMGES